MPGQGSWEESQRGTPSLVEPVVRSLGPTFDFRTFDEGQEACAMKQGIGGDGRTIVPRID